MHLVQGLFLVVVVTANYNTTNHNTVNHNSYIDYMEKRAKNNESVNNKVAILENNVTANLSTDLQKKLTTNIIRVSKTNFFINLIKICCCCCFLLKHLQKINNKNNQSK